MLCVELFSGPAPNEHASGAAAPLAADRTRACCAALRLLRVHFVAMRAHGLDLDVISPNSLFPPAPTAPANAPPPPTYLSILRGRLVAIVGSDAATATDGGVGFLISNLWRWRRHDPTPRGVGAMG